MITHRVRTVFISDTHLGTRFCKADYLLDFLQRTESTYLFLVGDIIDFWSLKGGWYWPASHNQVLHEILAKAARGTRVIYVPGNHDEVFRDHIGAVFAGVEVATDYIHNMLDGRRLLVIHGDEFDNVVKHSKLVAKIGSDLYDFLLWSIRWIILVRRRLGFTYWSLAAYVKHKVKNAVNFVSNFEQAIAREARRRQVQGVVCGHIHRATIARIDDVLYCNDGDWVESCTALVEHHDGRLALIHWADEQGLIAQEPALAA